MPCACTPDEPPRPLQLTLATMLVLGCGAGPGLGRDVDRALGRAAESGDAEAERDVRALEAAEARNFYTALTLACIAASAGVHGDGARLGEEIAGHRNEGYVRTDHLDHWHRDQEACRKHCRRVVEGRPSKTVAAPLPRDRALAEKHLARCDAEKQALTRAYSERRLAPLLQGVSAAGWRGDYLAMRRGLRALDLRAAEPARTDPDSDIAASIDDAAASVRRDHAEGLARAAAYLRDARVRRLRRHHEVASDEMHRLLEAGTDGHSRSSTDRGVRVRRLMAERDDLTVRLRALQAEYDLLPDG